MAIITLNIGGKKIQTYRSTIEKLPFFSNYLSKWNVDEIFVDYDCDMFIHLLNKLRDDKYEMPTNQNITTMCDYFGFVDRDFK